MQPGELIFGRYRVTRELGRGGMGAVYLGWHESLEFPVALKVLTLEAGPDARARFLREAQLLARVRHPSVVAIHDLGVLEDGLPCIVMEYLSGESLGTLLDRERSLPWQAAVDLLLPVMQAIGAMHRVGILHRDLKPDNILVTPHGAKLVDFGIAVRIDGDGKLTRTGFAVGTPGYMAPEQALGMRITPASDVFALGVVLFECLAGIPPFDGGDLSAVLRAARFGDVRPCHAASGRPMLPERLRRAVEAALIPDPAERISLESLEAEVTAASSDARQGAAIHATARTELASPAHPELLWQSATALTVGDVEASAAPRLATGDAPPETPAPLERALFVCTVPSSRLRDPATRRFCWRWRMTGAGATPWGHSGSSWAAQPRRRPWRQTSKSSVAPSSASWARPRCRAEPPSLRISRSPTRRWPERLRCRTSWRRS